MGWEAHLYSGHDGSRAHEVSEDTLQGNQAPLVVAVKLFQVLPSTQGPAASDILSRVGDRM
jgi:hypothetical protein